MELRTRLRGASPVPDVAGPLAITLGVAALVVISGQDHGGYYVDVWAPLGLVLLGVVAMLLFVRRAPALLPAIAAGALLAIGGWGVLSTQWGGLPNAALTLLGQSITAAAALIAGSTLAVGARSRAAVYAGVLLGVTAHTVEILVRIAANGGPSSWFLDRVLEGPVGYHNAQAAMFVVGVPLALATAAHEKLYVRVIGGGVTSLLLGGLVLTQSRGGLLAAGIGAVVLLAWSRDLRLVLFSVPVLATATGLLLAVRRVDAALVGGTAATHVHDLRRYVIWCAVGAVALAAVAAGSLQTRQGRIAAVAVAGLCLVFGVAGGIHERASIERTLDRVTNAASGSPDQAPGGETRFASLSLNGRREAWRVAWKMAEERPLVGRGQGDFSRRWGTDRPASAVSNYVLQPHSLELELLAELGIVGLGAFGVFLGAVVLAAVRAPGRRSGAIAVSILAALIAAATVDWTWSFSAIVVPLMLIVGATAAGTPIRRLRLSAAIAVPALIGAAIVLAAPYLSDRQLSRSSALATKDPDQAWQLGLSAQRLNPWDDRVYALQGRLAEASGLYAQAAAKYEKSATLARQPWVAYFQEAGAFQSAKNDAGRVRACRLAQAANPTEPLLREGACK